MQHDHTLLSEYKLNSKLKQKQRNKIYPVMNKKSTALDFVDLITVISHKNKCTRKNKRSHVRLHVYKTQQSLAYNIDNNKIHWAGLSTA